MTIINTTKHNMYIHTGEEDDVKFFPAAENPIHIQTTKVVDRVVDGIPVRELLIERAFNVPPEEEGVWYIVNRFVANMLTDREDFLVIGDAIKNKRGNVVGARGLQLP